MWRDLIKVLGDINAVYEKIFVLGKKKHDYLVTIKLAQLEPLLKEEQKLVDEVQLLEHRRQSVLVKMAGANKDLRPDMTMRELIAFAPVPLQQTLAVMHKQLNGKVDEVVKQNDINSLLATGALDAVTKMLNRLGGAKVDATYGSKGGETVSHRRKLEINA